MMESEEFESNQASMEESPKQRVYEWKIVWTNVAIFIYVHLAGLYGLYLACFEAKRWTIIWAFAVAIASNLGITAGAHRLWAHRTYKAKWPMKLILTIFESTAHQNSIYDWSRDHRVHHKYTDTDADPHNSSRGFFFSHIGWLLIRKHPDVLDRGAMIDLSDLEKDPFVTFQRKWYKFLMPLCCFILPTLIPYWAWNETLWCAWHVILFRYCINLNTIWLVNSAAHMWGVKPYDRFISPTEHPVIAFSTLGEGWHNYHHVFPWDYKAAELGNYRANFTTAFIDFFAYLGLAYDLKTVDVDVIKKRALRSGDELATNLSSY